jgi:predicted DNA-binding transcriptional regulator AlpA
MKEAQENQPADPNRWVSSKEVAQFLGVGVKEVTERLRKRPDFPSPMRLSMHGEWRWRYCEIDAWSEKQRTKLQEQEAAAAYAPRVGRPRKNR